MRVDAYPWYECVSGEDLQQGDIIEQCPLFSPPSDLRKVKSETTFERVTRNVIVISQSCDLVQNQKSLSQVLLCTVWDLSKFVEGHLATPKGKEDARRGNIPGMHMLGACDLDNYGRDPRIVDFRELHTLPLPFFRSVAAASGHRIRLLPPYREHLAQAFARFFMRVGLPVDIPPFR